MNMRALAAWFPFFALGIVACSQGADPTRPTVAVHVGSGNWAEANLEAYVLPFERSTGITVVRVADDMKLANIQMQNRADNVEVDVISLPALDALRAAQLGELAEIDYSIYAPQELARMAPETRKPWGVGALYYSMVLAWNARSFPDPATAPRNWADFWNAGEFPGARTLVTGQYGDGPWEEALLADGVPIDRIYPMDVDRVFRSLDRIRPQVVKWWRVGSEGSQLFRDGQVVLGGIFDGRVSSGQAAPADVAFTFEQGKLMMDYWVIPKRSKHPAEAQRFIEFATRASQQAVFSQKISYGPTNLGAYDHIPPERARLLSSHPDNLARQFNYDHEWYLDTDENGVSNYEKLMQRWNEWILQ